MYVVTLASRDVLRMPPTANARQGAPQPLSHTCIPTPISDTDGERERGDVDRQRIHEDPATSYRRWEKLVSRMQRVLAPATYKVQGIRTVVLAREHSDSGTGTAFDTDENASEATFRSFAFMRIQQHRIAGGKT